MARARARSRVKAHASESTRPPEPPGRPGAKGWLGLVAVLLLGALAYSSSLRGEFLFDDVESIVENPAIRDLGSILGRSGHAVPPNRYVAYLSFALSYLAGGLDPLGWHLANLAIHLANAALVWASCASPSGRRVCARRCWLPRRTPSPSRRPRSSWRTRWPPRP